jgi:hypothetical protein
MKIRKLSVAETPMADFPFGAKVHSGNPVTKGSISFQTSDKCLSGGVWTCTAGTFDWTYTADEMIYVLEGEAYIEDESGTRHHLVPGDTCFCATGWTAKWIVPRFIKKFFVLRTTGPLG